MRLSLLDPVSRGSCCGGGNGLAGQAAGPCLGPICSYSGLRIDSGHGSRKLWGIRGGMGGRTRGRLGGLKIVGWGRRDSTLSAIGLSLDSHEPTTS